MTNAMTGAGVMAGANDTTETREGYARIGDMAQQFGVTLRALRFYEDKGLLHPARDGGTRLYSQRDKTRLGLILRGRKIGFSLREVKQMMDLYDPDGTNARQMRVVLERSERQLRRLERQRAAIDEAIRDLTRLMTDIRNNLETPRAATG